MTRRYASTRTVPAFALSRDQTKDRDINRLFAQATRELANVIAQPARAVPRNRALADRVTILLRAQPFDVLALAPVPPGSRPVRALLRFRLRLPNEDSVNQAEMASARLTLQTLPGILLLPIRQNGALVLPLGAREMATLPLDPGQLAAMGAIGSPLLQAMRQSKNARRQSLREEQNVRTLAELRDSARARGLCIRGGNREAAMSKAYQPHRAMGSRLG